MSSSSSSHNSNSHHHSEGAKAEQIITEFFAKSLHIILESRTPYMSSRNFSGEQMMVSSPSSSSSSSSSVRPRDKWFNLALRECPAALENFDIWRQSNLEPLVVDVVLMQRPLDMDPIALSSKRELIRNLSGKGYHSDQDELGFEGKNEKVIERWIVKYDNRKMRDCSGSGRRSSNNKLQLMYKKAILMLRSLFAMVRLLPAYKIFRDLNSSGQICKFNLVPRVPSIIEPFTRREEAEMQKFAFTPVDTSCGRLCLSVLYRSSADFCYESSSSPMSPTFISDYVGSPLADPLKRFTSLPLSHASPSSSPFSRRHSWSFDQYKASSPPSASFSPSPTHSDSHALVPTNRSPRLLLPPHPSEICGVSRKYVNNGESMLRPDFSSSSSPIHIPGSQFPRGIVRTESAPVRIPVAKLINYPSSSSRQSVPPSPPPKLSRHGSLKPTQNSGLVESRAAIEKMYLVGREDPRRQSGVRLSSNGSPQQISFSRSSSRSFPDDFDDPDFPCPFDVEYDDIIDPSIRPESYDGKGETPEGMETSGLVPMKKSQDAAVGALVKMLKKAPPLRIDLSEPSVTGPENHRDDKSSTETTSAPELAASSSLVAGSKTTADALEELKFYKDMKNLLLGFSSPPSSS